MKSLGMVLGMSLCVTGVLACGDDEGGGSCDKAEDCPAVECDDGSSVRICLNGECATKDEACGSGNGGGW